jgi:alkylation response protein AidB-like acyl-CoA dehydrogenase
VWRVGEENAGFQMVMATFDYSRAVISREVLGREFKPY